jgi:hypothetical protein
MPLMDEPPVPCAPSDAETRAWRRREHRLGVRLSPLRRGCGYGPPRRIGARRRRPGCSLRLAENARRRRISRTRRPLFRRGYLPMGDVHDILDRTVSGIKPLEAQMMEKFIFYEPRPTTKADFDNRYALYKKQRDDTFLKIFGEECDKQWDRIIDRRSASWFYAAILNTVISFVVGLVVGKFLL